MTNPRSTQPVIVRQLDDGRWKITFPDGLTILTANDTTTALALVPTGHDFHIIPRDPDP